MKAIIERLDKIEEILSISMKDKEHYLNINGVAEYTSLSIPKIRKAVKSGELKSSMKSGRHLFKVSWVDKWLRD